MTPSGSFQRSRQTSEDKGDKKLKKYFNRVKEENYTDSFEDVGNWLLRANMHLKNGKKQIKERKLQSMKQFFFVNKLRLGYTVVALALVVAACNMPVTQTENAGYMLAWTVPVDNTDTQSKISELPWLKDARLTNISDFTLSKDPLLTVNKISHNGNGNGKGKSELLYTAALPNTSQEQVDLHKKDLEALGEVTSIKITPLDYDVKRPLYSAAMHNFFSALHNFFSINIDATGKSDEEVHNEVQRKLREQGVDMNIQFKTGTDGKRDIIVNDDGGNDKLNNEPKQFEINIDDKNGQEKIKLMQKKADPDQFKGKTDSEIRQMIREETGNSNLEDDQIKITRDGEKIRVKVENDVRIKEPVK